MKLLSLALPAIFALTACMGSHPPQELVDARAAYARAYVGPAAQTNVSGLHDAKRSLDEAEAKFGDDPSSEEARHLAYLAHRRVLLAETNARATIAAVAAEKARTKLHEVENNEDRDRKKARTTTP